MINPELKKRIIEQANKAEKEGDLIRAYKLAAYGLTIDGSEIDRLRRQRVDEIISQKIADKLKTHKEEES